MERVKSVSLAVVPVIWAALLAVLVFTYPDPQHVPLTEKKKEKKKGRSPNISQRRVVKK